MMSFPKQRARGMIEFPLIRLPDELLLQILSYLNQVDAIRLSLTCKRFKKVTRLRLSKVLNVYNKGWASIPGNYYGSHYTNFTHIGLQRFLDKLLGSSFTPECKQVCFQNDETLDISLLDLISSKLELCMFSIYRISKPEVQRWILQQKDPSRVKVHHISTTTRQYMGLDERIYDRNLTITNSDKINLKYELSRYSNLKYLCIHNLREDDELPRVSATRIRIRRSERFDMESFFECFDIDRITSLNLENALIGIVPLAPRFVSLLELTIKEDAQIMVTFVRHLVPNSLTSLTIPNASVIELWPALNHHRNSLRFIKCEFDPSYILRRSTYEAKQFYKEIDIASFPKLAYVIHLGVALKVDRVSETFADVWFHRDHFLYYLIYL